MKIEVKVKPSSGRQAIEKVSDKSYLIHLKKAPEDNKANLELLKLLKKHFKKPVKIARGKTSKNKIVEVED